MPNTKTEDPQFVPASDDSYEQELKKLEAEQGQEPAEPTGEIDAAEFVRALSEFNRVQTWFLTHGSAPGALVKYSLAQGEFIEAQRKVLEQLGVV